MNLGSIASTASLALVLGACGALEGSADADSETNTSPIIGGTGIDITQAPWQVAAYRYGHFNCGGSIINKDWIITAGHCGVQVGDKIAAGQSTLRSAPDSQVRDAAQVVRPSDYKASPHKSDIALVRLNAPLDLSGPKARSISLPTASEVSTLYAPGRVATVSGWGLTVEGGTASDRPATLMRAEVALVSDQAARQAYGNQFSSDQVGARGAGKDSCQQDSGGPLVTTSNGRAVLIGVISWATGCADPQFPGMNTKVGSFLTWIANTSGVR